MSADSTGAQLGQRVATARWFRIGIPLLVIYFLCFVDRANISVATPSMVRELNLTGLGSGVLLSSFFWGYIVTMVPGGWVAARTSAVRTITVALAVVGLTACLTGVVTDYHGLLAVRFTMGLAEGVLFPSFAVLLLNWFPAQERGRAVSLSLYAIPLSSAVATPLGAWMIAQWDWQTMFILQGAPAFLVAVVFYWLASDDPATDQRLSQPEREFILAHRQRDTAAEAEFRTVLSRPLVWVLSALLLFWMTGLYGFNLWLPSLVSDISNSGVQAVGWLAAAPYALGALGMYVNSAWSDRASVSRGWFVAVPVAVAGLALLAQHYLPGGLGWNMVLLSIASLGLFSAIGTWWSWGMSILPRNQAGPAVGLVNMIGNFGGIVGPPFITLIAEKATDGFYALGFFALTSGIIAGILSARESRIRSTDRPTPSPVSD